MRLAEHLTALCAWCKQRLPGRRKPDVLRPGPVGMRGFIFHTTRAVKDIEYTPPPCPCIRHLNSPPMWSCVCRLEKAEEEIIQETEKEGEEAFVPSAFTAGGFADAIPQSNFCLLYTSDAADE